MKESVLAHNFGLETHQEIRALVPSMGATLEHVCLISSSGGVSVALVSDAVEYECNNFHGRLRALRLEFMSNIIATLASERKISPSSLIYIEGVFYSLAQAVTDDSDFRASTSAIINVRTALYDQVTKLNQVAESVESLPCKSAQVFFSETFSKEDANCLAQSIGECIRGGGYSANVSSFRSGSTAFEIIVSIPVAATTFLIAFNCFLAQAKISIQKLSAVHDEVRVFAKKIKSKATAPKRAMAKLPAIMRSGAVLHDLAPVRTAVQRSGKRLVRMDTKAAVTLLAQSDDMKETRD